MDSDQDGVATTTVTHSPNNLKSRWMLIRTVLAPMLTWMITTQSPTVTMTGFQIARSGHGSDPLLTDSDGDGFSDGEEVAAGTSPTDSR